MKYLTPIAVILLSFCIFSCNKNNFGGIRPSSTQINFEGEGGRKEISFANGNWEIAKVINQNNDQKIYGDVYAINGSLIQENTLLELDSLGKLEAFWPDKGFSIIRETSTSIEVHLKENFTKRNFGFTLVLISGNELKKIKVNQKPSQGYTIKSIKYTLGKDDGDSMFVQQGKTYSFDNNTSLQQKVSFGPFANAVELSHFESHEEAAFPWKEADSVMVEVPTKISGNTVLTNGEKSPYSSEPTQKESKLKEQQSEKVTIPLGHSEFAPKIEYRKRSVTYTLHLINKRTKEDRIITGKWIGTAPTGKYEIDWK